MELVHCIYCSVSTSAGFGHSELSALLEKCRINNAKFNVTGMLLYKNHSFFQVLEGDRPTIEFLFEKISADTRHKRVTKVILEPIDTRTFGRWSMGHPRVTSKELAKISGLNDFFGHASSYLELGEGRAKTLLAAFKDGQWQSRFS